MTADDVHPSLVILKKYKDYFKGVPSPLVSVMGNPHFVLRPMRQALYHKLGFKKDDLIKESFPYFDQENDKISWRSQDVKPSP